MVRKNKRFLVFNDCFYMGGTEILLVNLLNHLIEKNHEVTLLLPNPSDENVLLSRVSTKVNVEYLFANELTGIKKLFFKNLLIFFPKLYRTFLNFSHKKYDSLVCFKDCFHSIMFADLQIPKILWIQNQPFERDYTSNNLKEFLGYGLNRYQIRRMNNSFEKYDQVICVSDSSKDGYIKYYNKGVQKRDIKVLYNALDLSDIKIKAEEKIEYSFSSGLKFITVIRLSYEKTVDRLIRVADRLRNERYDFSITILGDGIEFENLTNLIAKYDLNDRVFMLGRVENPFPFVQKADWFVCPSSRESFALTLIESITLRTPVITTECGGPEDVVGRGKYGILTENSEQGVYNGMKKVLDDQALLQFYMAKKDECLERFDYNKWLSEVDTILDI